MTDELPEEKRVKLFAYVIRGLKSADEFFNSGSSKIYKRILQLESKGLRLEVIATLMRESERRRVRKCSRGKCGNKFYYEGFNASKDYRFCPDCIEKMRAPRIESPSDNNVPPLPYHFQLSNGFALLRSGDDCRVDY